jgi:large subunit ribosomal protein L17
MLRNMATSLILSEQCETTVEKAKEIRPVIEKLITKAKSGTLASRRNALGFLQHKDAVHKLYADLAERFRARNGGYTRIIRTRIRPGDAASMAVISLTDRTVKPTTTEVEKA